MNYLRTNGINLLCHWWIYGADQRKHQSSASLAFVRGTHRRPVNSPHKMPVTRKIFPFDDVIMATRQEKGRHMSNFELNKIRALGEIWCNCNQLITFSKPAKGLSAYVIMMVADVLNDQLVMHRISHVLLQLIGKILVNGVRYKRDMGNPTSGYQEQIIHSL